MHLIGEIDPEAFIGDLPFTGNAEGPSESRNDCLVNLKHIHDALTAYIVNQCCKKLPLPSGEPNLEAIAQAPSAKEVTQLLKLVLLAAVFGRFSMDHIQQLISLSEDWQAQFYLILEEPESTEIPEDEPFTEQKVSTNRDDGESSQAVQGERPELVYEERIAELVAAEKDLKREKVELTEQLESMHDLHTKLQKNYDNLEIQHQDTAERLDALRSGKGEKSMLGIQRTKMQQQETVIATLETQLKALQDENNNLKAQSEILENRSQGFQQLQDDVFEIKLEREQLRRRANAADKYKQKLQSLHEVEQENEALKHRATEMQRQLKQSDAEQFNNSDLRRENDEFRRLVANIEQELSDSNEAKKRAEFEKLTLAAKLQQADDQAKRWHTRAEELQNMVNEHSTPATPTTPRAAISHALDLVPSEDGSVPESNLSEGMCKMDVGDQNVISQAEWETMLRIMRAHAQSGSNAEKTISIDEQQKLATKIENMRVTARETAQVFEILALPRVEFVGVKALDEESPYKVVSPNVNDVASTYGAASQSARSSVTSLSAASRKSSVASFHSAQSAKPRKGSTLRGLFG
jgi:protein HOOK3